MSNTQLEVTNALKLIAEHYHLENGVFAYQAFEHINATFFDGQLPAPLIQWALTPFGNCLGRAAVGGNKPEVVTLHPSILSPRGYSKSPRGPWSILRAYLGMSYAYEVLLHECIHIAVSSLLGGYDPERETSHNNPKWISEVKRIAPMLGLPDNVSGTKSRRVPVPGEFTKTGKPKTKVVRGVDEGCLPFETVYRFPHAMREELGSMDFYRDKRPPWEIQRYPVAPSYVLQIPEVAGGGGEEATRTKN